MADDLDRFVHDEPIRARRATAVERFARWSRRNRGTAASLVAVAALLVFGIVGSAMAAIHYQRQEQIQRQLKNQTAELAERET